VHSDDWTQIIKGELGQNQTPLVQENWISFVWTWNGGKQKFKAVDSMQKHDRVEQQQKYSLISGPEAVNGHYLPVDQRDSRLQKIDCVFAATRADQVDIVPLAGFKKGAEKCSIVGNCVAILDQKVEEQGEQAEAFREWGSEEDQQFCSWEIGQFSTRAF